MALAISAGHSSATAAWYVIPLYWVSLVPFLWFVCGGLAEALRMRVAPIFLVASTLTTLSLFAVLIANARGVI